MRNNAADPDPSNRHEGERALLDAERLDVYRVALEFQWAIVANVRIPRSLGPLRDQFNRASSSIVFNIAEGAGRNGIAEKAHFYSIARGSAMECAAILDVLAARGAVSPLIAQSGRTLLVRIVQMLTRLRESPRPTSRETD